MFPQESSSSAIACTVSRYTVHIHIYSVWANKNHPGLSFTSPIAGDMELEILKIPVLIR